MGLIVDASPPPRLSCRARLTWFAHLFKACVKQHHRELIAPLRRFIPADGVVLDVGGHAGQFAKLFARMAPQGRIYTVEPGAYALSILRPAIRFNRLHHVTILPVGLSDTPGSSTLHVPVKQSGSLGFGLSHVADDTGGNGSDTTVSHTISLTTVDDLVKDEKLTRLDFIKADIEGFELRMIHGAQQTLARFRPSMVLEVDRRTLTRAGDTPEAVFSFFESIDYRAYMLTPDLKGFVPADSGRDNDVFFVPSERSSIMDDG